MARVSIQSNAKEMARLLGKFGDDLAPDLAAGLNASAAGVKTDVVKQLRAKYGLSREAATKAVGSRERKANVKRWKHVKASGENLTAGMTVAGNPLPLYLLNPSPTAPMRGKTTGGVTVSIKGRRHAFSHAFTARMRSGHNGVFTRAKQFSVKNGQKHEVIRERFSESIPQLADDDVIVEPIAGNMEKRMVKKFIKSVDKLVRSGRKGHK